MLKAIHHEEPDRVPVAPRIGARLVPWLRPQDGPHWKREYEMFKQFGFDPYIEGIPPPGPEGIPILPSFGPTSRVPPGLEGLSVEVEVHELDLEYDIMTRTIRTPEGILRDRIKIPKPRKFAKMRESWNSTCPPSWFPDAVPFTVERLVKNAHDAEKIRFMLPDPDAVDEHEIEQAKRYVGKEGLISYMVNPIDQMLYAIGLREGIVAYYRQREILEILLRILFEHSLAMTRSLLEKGAEIIFHGNYMGGVSAGWNPKIWNELFKPMIKSNRDLVKAMGGIFQYYDDGNLMKLLEGLKEIQPDVLTVAPSRFGNDFQLMKSTIGDRVCLKGGIDPDTVRFETIDRIDTEIRESIRAAARGGGFILSSSDSIHAYTPLVNIKRIVDSATTYGRYPIQC